jgi:hypothetical protein
MRTSHERQPLCDERPTGEMCLCCERHPPRAEFDGESRMWTEWIAERPLYCQECFDFIEGEDTEP